MQNNNNNKQQNINDSQLVGAGRPLILADGTQWILNPFTDKDLTELDNWVKKRYLVDQRNSIDENTTEEQKDRIERVAQQVASTLCWYLGLGAEIMASLDGMSQLIYQAAKKNYPELTYDIVHEKLLSQGSDAIRRANETIDDVNEVGEMASLKKNRKRQSVKSGVLS